MEKGKAFTKTSGSESYQNIVDSDIEIHIKKRNIFQQTEEKV